MKDASDRRALEPTASASKTGISRIGRILFGGLIVAIGVLMAGAMAVAMLHEILVDDFFGVAVSAMVVVFGIQLTKIGYRAMTGAQKPAADPSALDSLWQSDTRVYPYLPYSHLDIRGR